MSCAIHVEGTTNLRDLGGYPTTDGRRVKAGVLYRSDSPHAVSAATAQAAFLETMHIRNMFDFRGEEEVLAQPYDFDGIVHHRVPVGPPSLIKEYQATGKTVTPEVMVELMDQTYRARIDVYAQQFARVLRFVIEQGVGLPHAAPGAVLFHCTAGKDRTGLMAALLLAALNVDVDHIMLDFMLTNTYLQRPPDAEKYLGGLGLDAGSMDVLWSADARFLQGAFAYIGKKYGGVKQYLAGPLGLSSGDLATLRGNLLV